MIPFFKSIFQHRCPTCQEPLRSHNNALFSEKQCPNGHYKEEIYTHLGVRIVYENQG